MDAGLLFASICFFTFSETNDQIHHKPDKGHRSNHPPQRFFAGGTEIFLGHIDDGPDGGQKKGDAQSQKYAQQF